MRKIRLVLATAVLSLAGLLFFIITVIAVIPNEFIYDILRQWIQQKVSLSLSGEDFKKVFPFGFKMNKLSISAASRHDREFLYFDTVQVNVNPLYVFAGGIKVTAYGTAGHGIVQAAMQVKRKKTDAEIHVKDVEMATIPSLNALGLKGAGILSGEARFVLQDSCPHGSVKIDGTDIELNSLQFIGPLLRLQEKARLSAAIDTKDCRLELKGLWVSAQHVSAKLYGTLLMADKVLDSTMDLTMEISSQEDSRTSQLNILKLLSEYKKSSNYYLLHIKGTFARPQLMP